MFALAVRRDGGRVEIAIQAEKEPARSRELTLGALAGLESLLVGALAGLQHA